MLESGLLTSQGDYHRRHKRMLAPTLHKEMVRQWGSVISAYCERVWSSWCHGKEVNIEREMLRLTLGIALKTLVSVELEHGADEMARAANTLIEMTDFRTLPLIDDLLDKIAMGRIRRFKEAKHQLDAIVYRMIRERRTGGTPINDLLCVLLRVRDEDSTALTDEEVRDETLSMLIAGHETTAHALTWTWYLLSQHPKVEQKLHAELDAVIPGKLPRTDDLESLPYTRMVFSEAMRLYPPLWIVICRRGGDRSAHYLRPCRNSVFGRLPYPESCTPPGRTRRSRGSGCLALLRCGFFHHRPRYGNRRGLPRKIGRAGTPIAPRQRRN
jgi:cytochrome P450